jgi:hypothetical protein
MGNITAAVTTTTPTIIILTHCPKDHNAFQQSQRQLVERWLGDDEPQREKGDTEEMGQI